MVPLHETTKTKMKTKKPNWIELLDEYNHYDVLKERPPNSFNIRQLAEKWGISPEAASRRVRRMFDDGKLEKHFVKGVSRPVPHYTIK